VTIPRSAILALAGHDDSTIAVAPEGGVPRWPKPGRPPMRLLRCRRTCCHLQLFPVSGQQIPLQQWSRFSSITSGHPRPCSACSSL
jgi:hypothetical protein